MSHQDRTKDLIDSLLISLARWFDTLNAERDDARKRSRSKAVLLWFRDNVAILTVLSAVVGGVWTAAQYFASLSEQREHQRRESIAQYLASMSDPSLRSDAVIAFAAMAQQEAVPLLVAQLKQLLNTGMVDPSFKSGLTQAFVLAGDVAVERIVSMNRVLFPQYPYDLSKSQRLFVDITQPALEDYLRRPTRSNTKMSIPFLGVFLQKTDMSYFDLSEKNLRGMSVDGSRFCNSYMAKVDLRNATIEDTLIGGANLSGSALDEADFVNIDLIDSRLDNAVGSNARFNGKLYYATFRESQFRAARFNGVWLQNADFSDADLERASFEAVLAYGVRFGHADLSDATFLRADLSNADFTRSNLKNARFFSDPEDRPVRPDVRDQTISPLESNFGAFVSGANFEGAENVSEMLRRYLCRWGGLNVPGGCEASELLFRLGRPFFTGFSEWTGEGDTTTDQTSFGGGGGLSSGGCNAGAGW